jgi:adenosylcobinamide kinase / adenosylcobinamide-phosphate guanylyltransferase
MVDAHHIARSELIIGGQKSGKSARAEKLGAQWLAASPTHTAVLVATAQAHDDEMQQRIARHQADRATRVPAMLTVEEPLNLANAIAQHSTPQTLLVVDCLTLWLTNQIFPYTPPEAKLTQNNTSNRSVSTDNTAQAALLLIAIKSATGPVVIVSNEIGLGVIPMGREVRAYVDALGLLNQDVARVCDRVTLMAAGLPLFLKDT